MGGGQVRQGGGIREYKRRDMLTWIENTQYRYIETHT